MIGYIFLIIAAIFVYRTAKQNDCNAVLWTFVAVATFFGVQIIVALAAGIFIAEITGSSSENTIAAYSFPIGLLSLAAGIGSVMMILRRVNKVPEEETFSVPPPPNFDENK